MLINNLENEIKELEEKLKEINNLLKEKKEVQFKEYLSEIAIQKRYAEYILFEVKSKLDPYAIIAGGAPRSWYLNQLANDIDIYLYYPNNLFMNNNVISNSINLIDNLSIDGLIFERCLTRDHEDLKEYAAKSGNALEIVIEYKYKDQIIQFIFMKTDEDRWKTLSSFKVSISEIYFDGVDIKATHTFMKSLETKVISLDYLKYNKESYYYKKLKSYFPDYKFNFIPYNGYYHCNNI